jgi:uncharacterized membrane protein YdjX (TVP38/TMEM64 family)
MKAEEVEIKKEKKGKAPLWINVLILLIAATSIAVIFYETNLIRFFMSRRRMLRFLDTLGPWAAFGLILFQAIQVVIAPIPGEATTMVGGYLYGPFLGAALSTIGVTIGSYIAFTLGRKLGRPFVEKYVSKSIVRRFDYLLHHKGAFIVFLFFLIPSFPKDSLCYLLGLGHLSSFEFIIIGGSGRLFSTILETLGGDFIRHEQYKRLFILMGIGLVVIFMALFYRNKMERLLRLWHIRKYKKKAFRTTRRRS